MTKISSVGVQRERQGAFLWDLSGECWRSGVMCSEVSEVRGEVSEWGWELTVARRIHQVYFVHQRTLQVENKAIFLD